jgi:hypothetical protein
MQAVGTVAGFVLGGGTGAFETAISGGALAPVAVAQTAMATTAGAGIGRAAGELIWGMASGFNSRTTARTKIGKQAARVDAELPTGHSPGEVHVQTKGPGGPQKYRVPSANDLSGLPRVLRENETIQRGITKAFELIERFKP